MTKFNHPKNPAFTYGNYVQYDQDQGFTPWKEEARYDLSMIEQLKDKNSIFTIKKVYLKHKMDLHHDFSFIKLFFPIQEEYDEVMKDYPEYQL